MSHYAGLDILTGRNGRAHRDHHQVCLPGPLPPWTQAFCVCKVREDPTSCYKPPLLLPYAIYDVRVFPFGVTALPSTTSTRPATAALFPNISPSICFARRITEALKIRERVVRSLNMRKNAPPVPRGARCWCARLGKCEKTKWRCNAMQCEAMAAPFLHGFLLLAD